MTGYLEVVNRAVEQNDVEQGLAPPGTSRDIDEAFLQLDDASPGAMARVKAVARSSKFSRLYLTLSVVTLAVSGLAVRRVTALRKIEPPEHRRNCG